MTNDTPTPTPIDWDVTEVRLAARLEIPIEGVPPITHEEAIPIPEWIIQSRDEEAYRKFWLDRAFEFNEAAHKATRKVMAAIARQFDIPESEISYETTLSDHPALELYNDPPT